MFNIQGLQGTREGVMAKVREAVELDQTGKVSKDQAQVEGAKAFIIAEINALPKEFNGVRIEASGLAHGQARQFEVRIFPTKLAV